MPGLHDTRSAPHINGPYEGSSKYANGYSSYHQSRHHHQQQPHRQSGAPVPGYYYSRDPKHLQPASPASVIGVVGNGSQSSGGREQRRNRSQSIGRSPPLHQQQHVAVKSSSMAHLPPPGGRPTAFHAASASQHTLQHADRGGRNRVDEETPSYWVEHLATFAVGKQYGLEWPDDGIRKLKQMEKNSAIWAQPMVLRLRPSIVSVEDENGELVEQFPMELVADPTAHLSTDPRDIYNNILLFVVREDRRSRSPATTAATPTEMHIFQCNRVSANEVVDDFRAYMGGHFNRVKTGRRDTGFVVSGQNVPAFVNGVTTAGPLGGSYTRTESREIRGTGAPAPASSIGGYTPDLTNGRGDRQTAPYASYQLRDDASVSSDSSVNFERDVNTLNRCFDDIERFVARIQSAAIAQREIEAQQFRQRRQHRAPPPTGNSAREHGILALRAQLPSEMEFVDILQKFKLSFNLLAKLKNHIHEPNAPELLHFLFTPLAVILDACQWGFGRNIAPQVQSPLLARETKELMQNCLTSKESDVWMSLGDAWRIAPEDWPGVFPAPYRPVFGDGYAPYGAPMRGAGGGAVGIRSGVSSSSVLPIDYPPPVRRANTLPINSDAFSTATLPPPNNKMMVDDISRLTLERDRVRERERRLYEEERRMEQERLRLAEERRVFYEEQERRSVASERPSAQPPVGAYYRQPTLDNRDSSQSSPVTTPVRRSLQNLSSPGGAGATVVGVGAESPRQRAYFDEMRRRRAKVVQISYDRVGQNPKELTVTRGEYLEVVNDTKNWWECRNVHNRTGYVPHTIMQVVYNGKDAAAVTSNMQSDPVGVNGGGAHSSSVSPRQEWSSSTGGDAVTSSAAPPPPTGGPPDLSTQLATVQLRTATNQNAQSYNDHDQLRVLHRPKANPQSQQLQDELQATLGRGGNKGAGEVLLGKRSPTSPQASLIIDERSTDLDVADWLASKGFSVRTMQVMEGQTGATLFALTKRQLQDFCGKDEGQRLYSQLLVQKNITGYGTKSAAELSAILNIRKQKSEAEIRRASLSNGGVLKQNGDAVVVANYDHNGAAT